MTHFPGTSPGYRGPESGQACGSGEPAPSQGAPPERLQSCLGRTPGAVWVRSDLALALHHHDTYRHGNSPMAAPRDLPQSDSESIHTSCGVCTASQAGGIGFATATDPQRQLITGPAPSRPQDTRSAPEAAQTPPPAGLLNAQSPEKGLSGSWALLGIRMHPLMCRFTEVIQRLVYTSWTFSSAFIEASPHPCCPAPTDQIALGGHADSGD